MSRKFATVSGFRVVLALILATILAGATTLHAQQTQPQSPAPAQQPQTQQPADQPPANPPSGNQQSSSQEASPEELPTRKPTAALRIMCGAVAASRPPVSRATIASISDCASIFSLTIYPYARQPLIWRRREAAPARSTRSFSIPSLMSRSQRSGADIFWPVSAIIIGRESLGRRPPFRDRPATASSYGGAIASTTAFL